MVRATSSTSTRRTGALLVVVVGLGVLAGLVGVVAGGPVDYLSAPTLTVTTRASTPLEPIGAVATASPTPTAARVGEPSSALPPWVGTALQVLGVLLTGGAAYLLVTLGRRALRRRRPRGGLAPPEAPRSDPLPPAVDRLAAQVAEARAVVGRAGSPRNAVVAAWIRLQRSVAVAGLPAAPAETPTEYLARVLAAWEVDRTALDELAELYREARFSDHPIGQRHRAAALRALAVVHADLARAAGRPSGQDRGGGVVAAGVDR